MTMSLHNSLEQCAESDTETGEHCSRVDKALSVFSSGKQS